LRGYTLAVPRGYTLRPTSDQVKESLFNMIAEEIPHATFLDVFAGTGNIGIEALSRGAEQVIFVEKSPRHTRILRQNIAACALQTQSLVYCGDANKILQLLRKKTRKFDIIFLDPPYRQTNMLQDILENIVDYALLCKTGLLVVEHGSTFTPSANIREKLFLTKNRRIGDTTLSFYRVDGDD
jgi:16S rRNA (guanine(966)-N(2))-methyltransferase RsmD